MGIDLERVACKENRQTLASSLGWFSIGIGLAELLAPPPLSRLCGLPNPPNVLRLMGLREIVTVIGILTQPKTSTWLKARVAGDVVDLGLMSASFFAEEARPIRLALATGAVAGVTALDVFCAMDVGDSVPSAARGAVHFARSVVINRSAE